MQHGALLGGVDLFAAKHRLNTPAQVALFGKLQEQANRFAGHAVFGVVEVEAHSLCGEALASLRVFGKERAKMDILDRLVVPFERLPGRALGQPRWVCSHWSGFPPYSTQFM